MNTDDQGYFLLLSIGERQLVYEAALKTLTSPIVVVDGMLPLLSACVERPPLGVLVDAPSAARIGAALVNPLFELRMAWPVMRCTVRPDGVATVMCTSPDQQGPLAEALDAIASGDPRWRSPWRRRHVRVEILCRARIRQSNGDQWLEGNCLDLSRNGLFFICYEPPEAGALLDVEVWDLGEKPASCTGCVVRKRRWEDGPELPGIGIGIDSTTVPSTLGSVVITRLAAGLLAS